MSRKTKRRPPEPRDRRWPWALAVLAIVLPALWWLFTSRQSPVASVAAPPAGASAVLSAFRPPDLHALVVAPTDDRTVVFGHHQGMLVSHDGGATWARVSGANGDAMGVAIPPGSQTAYAAGHDVFFRSDDGGATWTAMRPSLPGTDIHGFAASATSPGAFYAYVVNNGLFRSDDGGKTWRSSGSAPGSTMSLAVGKQSGRDVLFAATMDGVARSRDGGKTWEPVRELADASHVSAAGDLLGAAAGRRVLVSSDGGETWQVREFPRGGAALIAVSPANTKLVYVVTERLEVWRSSDDGLSWERAG